MITFPQNLEDTSSSEIESPMESEFSTTSTLQEAPSQSDGASIVNHPEVGSHQDQAYSNKQEPANFDVATVDAYLPTSIISSYQPVPASTSTLPPDPILLSIGKPIRIPITEYREFHPLDNFHEEPTDLALSNSDEPVTTDQSEGESTEDKGATEHRYNLRRSNRALAPSKKLEFNDAQTRFLILMRAYWGMEYPKIAAAATREFVGDRRDNAWTVNQIIKRLGASRGEPKFKAYWQIMEKARRNISQPVGLSVGLLKEARGFLRRMKKRKKS